MTILGIDPGKNTGIAVFQDGKLSSLETITPKQIPFFIAAMEPKFVCFEDSRLQSVTWSRGVNHAASLKIARDVGRIDALCDIIASTCESLKISYVGISPKSKGRKYASDEFKKLTGWDGSQNQHCRDAAMVAYKYRNYKVAK